MANQSRFVPTVNNSLEYMTDQLIFKIVIVAYYDHEQYPIWYKVTTSIEEASKYYSVMLSKPNVHIISTRVIKGTAGSDLKSVKIRPFA